ncbi:glycosyltransferase family 2 protein [Anaeroarcus burkinensis]|uniref:glycosyltransferase family 2 protein n=1 Tax=Anaeroarcus burkinensis TaxID=82376 RepID=UPI00041AF1EE|nr:glycosyltransferase family 2 protein [Anaeroarcus burkinensis]
MNSQRIGVVTVTYNSGDVIIPFIESLLKQSYENFTLYIIDNASSDNTISKIEKFKTDKRICLIENHENLGVAKGNNQGITAALDAGCKSVLLINNDTEFESLLIEKLQKGMLEYDCDMIAPKMMYHDKPDTIWFAGGYFLPKKAYFNTQEGKDQKDIGQYDVPRQIECAPTCCLLVSVNTFRTIGLMDEKYFVYYDDTDFCLRAFRAGLKMYLLPSAKLTHKVSSLTGGALSPFVLKYTNRNLVYYIKKNISKPIALFWILCLQGVLLRRLIFRRDSRETYLIRQKALIEGLKM